jgi:protein-tyrosine phosphatase
MTHPTTPRAKSLLRRALPERLLRAIRVYRELDASGRASLPRVWLRRLFAGRQQLPALPASPNLLFVCRGNILRSAVAQAMFQNLTRSSNGNRVGVIASAGTAAADGTMADPRGLRVASELGLDLSGHRAQQLRQAAVDQADLILVMDYVNEAEVLGQYPAAASKVRLLGTFGSDQPRTREIMDPYSGTEEDVRQAFLLISEAVRRLAAYLSLSPPASPGNSRTGTT